MDKLVTVSVDEDELYPYWYIEKDEYDWSTKIQLTQEQLEFIKIANTEFFKAQQIIEDAVRKANNG